MMAGLGLAETTPGPLIMVLQFVGFVAAWQNPGDLPPLAAATLGALMTTWVTFLPCFLFVFLGAPHVEGLRERPALAIRPDRHHRRGGGRDPQSGDLVRLARAACRRAAGSMDFVAVVAVGAWLAMERFKIGVIPTLGACAALGMIWKML